VRLQNPASTARRVVYFDSFPNFVKLFFHTLVVELDKQPVPLAQGMRYRYSVACRG
jgi:hypothetical protein